MKVPVIESERLYFVPVSLAHLSQQYVNWLNDKDVYRYMETRGNYSLGMLKLFLEECEQSNKLFWAIHLKSNEQHIGNIKIDPINLIHGNAEYSIMMGRKEEWGNGYAIEASARILKYCFDELKLRKITLGVIKENTAAVKLYDKLGFKIEGTYQKHVIYDGKYHDVLRMALFNSNFVYGDQ
ncbi:GNAT family N-acetyltransferase [Mucilaginibacter sp. McL0603]|uniref:GNAT family N-acetyltransferase n=1 Tax=Mucilaginibacter sp. McL0603 TaxID=3415670 RepID=UPI003CED627A